MLDNPIVMMTHWRVTNQQNEIVDWFTQWRWSRERKLSIACFTKRNWRFSIAFAQSSLSSKSPFDFVFMIYCIAILSYSGNVIEWNSIAITILAFYFGWISRKKSVDYSQNVVNSQTVVCSNGQPFNIPICANYNLKVIVFFSFIFSSQIFFQSKKQLFALQFSIEFSSNRTSDV